MRTKVFILLLLIANLSYCQPLAEYDKRIVENYSAVGVLEAPFLINELIEIYQRDSLIIKRIFNKEIFNRTQYTLYCYNICADFFHNRLIEKRNNENKVIVDKMISEIDYDKNVIKPQIAWSNVFKTCLTCPFGEYPDDRFFYFQFSIMFMEKQEIKEMIEYGNGSQWKYALMAIQGGDAFTLNKEENYKQYVLDRRIANYIIDRWKDSDIKEIQELIAVYKSLL